MSCYAMEIARLREEAVKIEERKKAAYSAGEASKAINELDEQITKLREKATQLEKDDEEFHKLMGDAQALGKDDDDTGQQHHKHGHNGLHLNGF